MLIQSNSEIDWLKISMDLRQLRYFVALADELHFRRAAERLNITQAPLSVAIQTLERELGGQLFLRTQRRVALTDVGAAFRTHAIAILDRVDQTLSDVHERVTGHAGRMRIGFTAAAALLPFFSQVVGAFRGRFPDVEVALRDMTSAGQIAALQDRTIDVGLMRSPALPHHSDIAFTPLLKDPLVVAMHEDNPLRRLSVLTIADLRDEPMIFYPPNSGIGIYDQLTRLCRDAGFVPDIVQEAREGATIVGLAASGLGIAIVPSELQCIVVPRLVFKPLADEGAMTHLLLASRAGEANASVAHFRHMIQASLHESASRLSVVP